MKKQWLKKGLAIVLCTVMTFGIMPSIGDTMTEVQAADNTEPTAAQYIEVDGDASAFRAYNLTGTTDTAKIKFGAADKMWQIAGADGTKTLALLSDAEFEESAYGSKSIYGNDEDPSETSEVLNKLKWYTDESNTTYFSASEKAKMEQTAVKTTGPDGIERTVKERLYLPDAENGRNGLRDTTICVGANNNIKISVPNLMVSRWKLFWLRSPKNDYGKEALAVLPGDRVLDNPVNNVFISVVPAFNLDLSSAIFASATPAATSNGSLSVTDKTFILRYDASASAIKNSAAVISKDKTKVDVSGIPSGTTAYLMIQNKDGAYAKAVTTDTSVTASEITIGSTLTTFENCKVWLEYTEDNITYAKNAAEQYNITYDANGGTGSMEAGTATEGVAFALPECGFAAPAGKQFQTWAINAVAGTTVNAGATYTFDAAATVYAVWQDIPVGKPSITTQPADKSVTEGDTATFAVQVSGAAPITYQWLMNKNDDKGFVKVDGATSSSYTTEATALEHSGYQYKCVATNAGGSVESNAATLKVAKKAVTYEILEGADSTWIKGSDKDLEIRGSGAYDKFKSVKINGKTLESDNYTVTEGSTILTLKKAYLNTLTSEKHMVEFMWSDGTASTSFIVKDAEKPTAKTPQKPQGTSPKTGDDSNILLWAVLLCCSLGGLATVILAEKKRRKNALDKSQR